MMLFEDFSIERAIEGATGTVLFTDNAQASESAASGTGVCPCGGFCHSQAHGDGTGASNLGNISYVSDYTALLSPTFDGQFSRWNGDASGAAIGTTFITYTFIEEDELPDPATVARSPDAVFSFSAEQREATRLALEEFSKISGIVFIEVEGDSMMDFLGVTGTGLGGYAFYPFSGRRDGGGIYIEGDVTRDYSEGTGMFQVILHEIGHAVGLKHPFDGAIQLDQATDNTDNTVMSYTWQGQNKTELPSLDFDAVQFLYGTPENSGKNDIVYVWDEDADLFTVTGTSGDDQISGINFQNNIDGGDGNDVILGGGADDTLIGGAGDDRLVGSAGANTLDGGAGNDILVGESPDDTLIGGDGDDTFLLRYLWNTVNIDGGDGFDIVSFTSGAFIDLRSATNLANIEEFRGSEFNDWFYGDAGDNRFIGGAGDDQISGGAGADYLDGGDGFDTLLFEFSDAAITVDLAAGTISGGVADGDTFLNFEAVRGSGGNDTIYGDDADNKFVYYGGSDFYDGRGGSDTLSVVNYSNVRVNLGAESIEFRSGDGNFYAFGTFTFNSIENIETGFSDDVLIGDAGENILNGGRGNDELTGGDGADTFLFVSLYNLAFGNDTISDFSIGVDIVDLRQLSGTALVSTRIVDGNMVIEVATDGTTIDSSITFLGISAAEWSRQSYVLSSDFVGTSGNDTYTGSVNGDLALGLAGDDTLSGGAGADELYGGVGNDNLNGDDGNDELYGGVGNDILSGGAGFDTAHYSDASAGVTINLGLTSVQNTNGAGMDTLIGIEAVIGSAYDDRLIGDGADNLLSGLTGLDVIFAGDGNDTAFGGDGNDQLRGEAGDDTLNGEAGIDTIFGGIGNDAIDGGLGNDRLYGERGNDMILAGDGDDVALGQEGEDLINGGAGRDLIWGGEDNDIINGDEGDDILRGNDGDDTLNGGLGADNMQGGSGINTLNGGDGNDKLIGVGSHDVLNGGEGDDFLLSGDGTSEIFGGAGRDFMIGGAGADTMDGGIGNDSLFGNEGDDVMIGGEGFNRLFGGDDNDDLTGGSFIDWLFGGTGNDILRGGGNADELYGEGGDDQIFGEDGNDLIRGNDGIDVIDGGSGNDNINGNAGADTLTGGAGADLLFGGSELDTFVFAAGDALSGAFDRILDLEAGELIDLGSHSFVGEGAFTGGGSFEVRYSSDGTTTRLQLDRDGDGAAEELIVISGEFDFTSDGALLTAATASPAFDDGLGV